jgi:hypothetical protein
MKRAVLAHTAGFENRAFRIRAATTSPYWIGAGGCSLENSGARIQQTCGSRPAAASASKVLGKVGTGPFAARTGSAWKLLK